MSVGPLSARLLVPTALFALVLTVSGCGGGKGSLAGKVSFQGKPVVAGTVMVYAKDGSVSSSDIHPDGGYEARDIPVGEVTLTVSSPDVTEKTSAEKAGIAPRGAGKGGGAPPARPTNPSGWFSIPEKYADRATSELKTTVSGGSNTFNIDLR
jgi:hypothetical protein